MSYLVGVGLLHSSGVAQTEMKQSKKNSFAEMRTCRGFFSLLRPCSRSATQPLSDLSKSPCTHEGRHIERVSLAIVSVRPPLLFSSRGDVYEVTAMASRSYRYLRLGRPRSGLTSLDSYYTTEPTTAAAEECTWPDHFALHLALPDQSAIRQNVPVLTGGSTALRRCHELPRGFGGTHVFALGFLNRIIGRSHS